MKKHFFWTLLILLCSASAAARVSHYNVRQRYSGEAKPRAEVAWVWLEYGIFTTDIDGVPADGFHKPLHEQTKSEISHCYDASFLYVVELLPGQHEIWVRYADSPHFSNFKLPLKFDAKAGEDYQIKANFKEGGWWKGGTDANWSPSITPFTPDADHYQARTECRYF